MQILKYLFLWISEMLIKKGRICWKISKDKSKKNQKYWNQKKINIWLN